jgi:hypothetical protein
VIYVTIPQYGFAPGGKCAEIEAGKFRREHIVRMEILESAVAGDADATAEVLHEAEALIRGIAHSEEEQQTARVTLWAALPGFRGDSWQEFRDYALEVLTA